MFCTDTVRVNKNHRLNVTLRGGPLPQLIAPEETMIFKKTFKQEKVIKILSFLLDSDKT